MERARHGTRVAKKPPTVFAADDRRMASLDGLLTCSLDSLLIGSTTRVARLRGPSFRPQRAVLTVSMQVCPMASGRGAIQRAPAVLPAAQLDKEHASSFSSFASVSVSFVKTWLKLQEARGGSPIETSLCSVPSSERRTGSLRGPPWSGEVMPGGSKLSLIGMGSKE